MGSPQATSDEKLYLTKYRSNYTPPPALIVGKSCRNSSRLVLASGIRLKVGKVSRNRSIGPCWAQQFRRICPRAAQPAPKTPARTK